VRCGAVRCGAVRCGAVRCGAVRCGAVPGGAVRCCAGRCGAAGVGSGAMRASPGGLGCSVRLMACLRPGNRPSRPLHLSGRHAAEAVHRCQPRENIGASTSIFQPKLVCERTEIMRRYHAMRERRVCAPPGLRVERAPSLPAERRACRSCCHFGGEKMTRQEQITCIVVELSQDIGAYRTSLELYPRHVEFPQDWTRGGWGFPVEHIDVRRRSRSHSK
jgi:hypothetical protein